MKMWYKEESFDRVIDALSKNVNLKSAAKELRMHPVTLTSYIKRNNIDLQRVNITKWRKIPDEDLFCISEKRGTNTINIRFFEKNPENYFCSKCGLLPEWNGTSLTIVLDHINGNPCDNRLENLRWLCPNCHSQTETYAGKNNFGKIKRVLSR